MEVEARAVAEQLIETLAHRAQEADRLEQENGLLREMLRLERLKKYGPKSEKLSEEQVELLARHRDFVAAREDLAAIAMELEVAGADRR